MAESKIDKIILSQLLRSGKSGKDCAKFFGVTPGAISQAKRELNISIVKNVALEHAHKVVEKNLNTWSNCRGSTHMRTSFQVCLCDGTGGMERPCRFSNHRSRKSASGARRKTTKMSVLRTTPCVLKDSRKV